MSLFRSKFESASSLIRSKWVAEAIDWAEVVVTSIIVVVILFTFVFRVVGIDGPSMMNTLNSDYGKNPLDPGANSDMVVISHLFYKPKVGDIVVVSRNVYNDETMEQTRSNQPIVKRTIAVGGDSVDIDPEGRVLVNGVEISEPYIREPIAEGNRPSIDLPCVVGPGEVFLMGDNRNNSYDSRAIGPVDERYILGRVILRIFPLNKIKTFPNPNS